MPFFIFCDASRLTIPPFLSFSANFSCFWKPFIFCLTCYLFVCLFSSKINDKILLNISGTKILLQITSESYYLQFWLLLFFLLQHDQLFTHTYPLRPLKLVVNSHSWLLLGESEKKKRKKKHFSVEQGKKLSVNEVQSPGDPGIS